MTEVLSIDPRDGTAVEPVAVNSTAEDVDAACQAAALAAPRLTEAGLAGRAAALRLIADALEADRAAIVALADRETALGETRLGGELTRTTGQLTLFADTVAQGAYLEASLDTPADLPAGRRPDLRRMLVPAGPVAVYGASNFPLAFSVPGGDTASALAAGCPVVVKAHPSHPATSVRCARVLNEALVSAGVGLGCLSLVHGLEAGRNLVSHPLIRAAAFTGSLRGGRALYDLAAARPDPIPFYAELGSLNPVVVLPGAAAQRADSIAAALAGSFTLGVGQFCTKPGVILVPTGADGDRLVSALAAGAQVPPGVMLSDAIREAFAAGVAHRATLPGVTIATTGGAADGRLASPALLSVAAAGLTGETGRELLAECFGPVTVAVRYEGEAELLGVLREFHGELTGTIHLADGDADLGQAARVAAVLEKAVGRLVYNGVPTGVAVSWSMHHGGPYPATTSLHTSVGTTAIRRFLRPICYQDAPEQLLPTELRSGNPLGIPRLLNGQPEAHQGTA
ncbi:MAG TPA: aldehyde dehydrogenase (NADP(+)) [Streptosporangiaceae bacterium]|jgi:NADP-dependent aldehyde dehydrogenase